MRNSFLTDPLWQAVALVFEQPMAHIEAQTLQGLANIPQGGQVAGLTGMR